MRTLRSALGLAVAAVCLAGPSPGFAQQDPRHVRQPTFIDQEYAALHALNKIAARVSQIWVPVGGEARFGRLTINVLACRKRPPEEPPEAAAFMEIVDAGADEQAVAVFRGWMFASSPSLSAMEHPLYDIWVAGCMTAAEAAADEALARTGGVEDMSEDEGSQPDRPLSSPPVPYQKPPR